MFIIIYYFKALGLALNFVGALIFIFGTMKTDKQIEEETGPHFLKNWAAKNFHLKARSISVIGLILISFGFLSQLFALLFEFYL